MKTAFLNACHTMEMKGEALRKADLAASFRKAVVESLVDKAMLAARETGAKQMAMAGGVSANRLLRRRMQEACEQAHMPFFMPQVHLCTDNGAMIGAEGYLQYKRGNIADLSLNAKAVIPL